MSTVTSAIADRSEGFPSVFFFLHLSFFRFFFHFSVFCFLTAQSHHRTLMSYRWRHISLTTAHCDHLQLTVPTDPGGSLAFQLICCRDNIVHGHCAYICETFYHFSFSFGFSFFFNVVSFLPLGPLLLLPSPFPPPPKTSLFPSKVLT